MTSGAVDGRGAGTPARVVSPGLLAFLVLWALLFLILSERPLTQLGEHWALIPLGFVGAVIGNATAIGGGIVFIPYLILFYDLTPVESLQLALATQAFGMSSGAIGWWQRRSVPLGALLRLLPALALGLVLSTLVVAPSPLLVKSVFGWVTLMIGVSMLTLAGRGEGGGDRIRGGLGLHVVVTLGGALTGWAAVGAGEVVAAWLILRGGVAPRRAIGLGVALLAIASIVLAAMHQFLLGGISWQLAALIIPGAVCGARMGPWVAQRVSPRVLELGFGSVALGQGVLFVWPGLVG
jgi:uncharacterized membrane protein YfcA